jgi:hypothetical protein
MVNQVIKNGRFYKENESFEKDNGPFLENNIK